MTVSNDLIMNALPLPVLTVGGEGQILNANSAAEAFFEASFRVMQRQKLKDLVPFGSPVLGLIDEVRQRGSSVSEYRIDIGSPRLGVERIIDVFATPLGGQDDGVVVMLQERTMADKMDRQLNHAGRPAPSRRSARCWPTRSKTRSPASGARRSSWSNRSRIRIGS